MQFLKFQRRHNPQIGMLMQDQNWVEQMTKVSLLRQKLKQNPFDFLQGQSMRKINVYDQKDGKYTNSQNLKKRGRFSNQITEESPRFPEVEETMVPIKPVRGRGGNSRAKIQEANRKLENWKYTPSFDVDDP